MMVSIFFSPCGLTYNLNSKHEAWFASLTCLIFVQNWQTCYVNLHCTSREALAVIFTPSPLSAEHRYSPDWFRLAENLSSSPWPTVFPSFIHVIVGVGFPVAAQRNIASLSSRTVRLLGVDVKLGRTANFIKYIRRSSAIWFYIVKTMRIRGTRLVSRYIFFKLLKYTAVQNDLA